MSTPNNAGFDTQGWGTEDMPVIASGAIARGRFTTLDTTASAAGNGVYLKQAGANDPIYGFTKFDYSDGDVMSNVYEGQFVPIEIGATPGSIVAGCQVMSDSSGCAVFTNTAGDQAGGRALMTDTTPGNPLMIAFKQFDAVPKS